MKNVYEFCLCLIFAFYFNSVANAQTTRTIGASGANYTTLKLAFDDINNGTLTGDIVLNVTDNTTETASAALYASGTGSANYTSVLVCPSTSGKTISGNLAAPLIDLNGADNVTIDGRVNHAGSTVSLTIVNESISSTAGTSTIRLIGDATNNNVKYCTIKGSTLSTASGILFFSTASASGNDGNTFEYNNITSNNGNRPICVLYAYGTIDKENNNNTIRNNNIFDFLNLAIASNGIHLSVYNTAWTLSGNSFYETTTFAPTANVGYQIIYTYNSGTSFAIDGNYFGGSGPLCSGTWTKTTGNNTLTCIFINNTFTTCTNSITNNTIKGLDFHNSGNASFVGILHYCSSSVNGVISGNTIGSATGNGSITIHNSGANGSFNGINSFTDSDINNNTIGSVTLEADTEYYFNFTGIHLYQGTSYSCSNNVIGSETTANSIISTSTSTLSGTVPTPGQYQTMTGIHMSPTVDNGTITLANNMIANITNNIRYSYTIASTIPVCGIYAGNAVLTINNNSIHDLTVDYYANSMINNTYNGGAVTAIYVQNNQTRTDIFNNEIYDLNATNTTNGTGHVGCTGIQTLVNNNEVSIYGNYIHDMDINTTSTNSRIAGIQSYNSVNSCYNNIVALGAGVTSSAAIEGIYDFYNATMTGARNALFNTVIIEGIAPSSTGGSHSFYSNYNNTRTIKNNIFYNTRSGGSATSQYAIGLTSNTSLTIDYNDYFASGNYTALGNFNSVAKASFAQWQTSTGGDVNSQVANPLFTLTPPATAHDLTPTFTSLIGSTGTGITTDYDGDTRSVTYPAMGALEYTVYPPIEVTATSGTTGPTQYLSLREAFSKINDGTHSGDVTVKVLSSTVETSSATLNASGTGSSSYTSVTVYPTVTGLSVSGNFAAPLINLNGADNVTIDGRVNMTGSSKDLVIMNYSTSPLSGTSTLRFINDACYNTVKYCVLKGSSYGTGTLIFGTAGTGSGNDNNTIDSNDLTSINDVNRTQYLILSTGTSGKENSGNVISNNNLFNFMIRNIHSEGISLADNNTGWTITGNSFYETSLFESTINNVGYSMIWINNTGSGYVITNNYIGGTESGCGGMPLTKSSSPQYTNGFLGIGLFTGPGDASSIQGNVISNIHWTDQTGNTFNMILVGGNGSYNIGTETGNILGSAAGNGSITYTSSSSNGGGVIGIYLLGSSGTRVIRNNVIGSITTHNPAQLGNSIFGISRSGSATTVIDGNIIGSTDPSTTNSLYATSPATAPFQFVIGIENDGAGDLTISNNTIAQLRDNAVCTTGYQSGIYSENGVCTITGNSIHDLSENNLRTDINSAASLMGIRVKNTSAAHIISGNTIYNLTNTNKDFAGAVTGIFLEGSSSVNTVSGNFIHHLSVNAATTAATLYGIKVAGGTSDCSNNIISLGGNTATSIYGIWDHCPSGMTGNYYFNTVYVGGTPTTGSRISCSFYSNSNGGVRNFRNNLFENARSNSGATGKHYAVYFNYGTPGSLTLDYNDYYAPGTGGKIGYFNSSDVTALPLITGKDAHSLVLNPSFTSAGGTAAANYTPQSTKILAVPGTGVTTDYSATTRSLTIPAMGAWEVTICIDPSDGGEISQDQTICSGITPGSFTSVHPASGEVGTLEYKWQYSITGSGTGFNDIASTNSGTYSPGSLTQDTWYRRLARVTCSSDWSGAISSNVLHITVEATPVAGSLAKTPNATNVCEGENVSAALTAGSGGNSVDSTYFRTNDGASWSSWANYVSGTNISTLDKTSVEIRTKRKASYCSDAAFNIVSWTVEQTPVSGTLAKTPNAANVCEGDNVSAALTAGSGGNSVDSTSYRTNNGTAWSAWANYVSGTSISTTNKTSIEIRTKRKASYCSDAAFNTESWTIEQTPVSGTLAKTPNAANVCEGSDVSAALTAGSGGNSVDSTSYRTNNGTVWSAWANYVSGTNISTTDKTSVEIRTKRKASYCSDAAFNTESWSVEQTPVSGTLAKTPNTANVCEGSDVSAVLNAGSGGNSVDSTSFRTHNGTNWSAWTNYVSGTNISTTDKTSVEFRTKRKATYCSDAAFNTESWSIHPRPNPFAGNDATISQLQTYTATTATASNHSGLLWETDGDGMFDDETSLDPVYTPGDDDIAAGTVELCLTASPESPCLSDSTDCLSLRICRCPSIVLSSPVHKQLLYANPVTITGTASDADNNLDLIEVRINGGSWQTATGTTSWSISLDLIPGKNSIEARAIDLTGLQSGIEQVEVTFSVQVINIPQGWSYISSYLNPTNPEIENMWADIVGANNLMIMTGVQGIYAPAPYFINTLVTWDVLKGYKVKMNAVDDLIVSGDSLTDKTLNFPAGVHLIPVLTNQTVGLDMVFENPETDILYMLDIYSNKVYWPGGILYTLTDLNPGKGYLANFKNPVTLSYPPLSNFTVDNKQNLPPTPGPWVCIRTSNIHLISVSTDAISQLQNAHYLGAFDSQGNCVGYAAIEKMGQNLLLTIYGDEPFTPENDGLLEGELLHFRSFNLNENSEKELTAAFNPAFPNADGLFVMNGLSGISGFKESSTGIGENDLAASVQVYPNPAKDVLNIVVPTSLSVHEASGLSGVEGNLLSAEGKLAKSFSLISSGTQLDVSVLPPGIYILKLKSADHVVLKRIVIQ